MTVSNQSSFADVKYLEKKDDHSSRPMVYASELNVDLSSENNMPLSEKDFNTSFNTSFNKSFSKTLIQNYKSGNLQFQMWLDSAQSFLQKRQ